MSCTRLVCAAVLAALLFPTQAGAATHAQHHLGLIRHDHVAMYARPSTHSRRIALLVEQTQIDVVGHQGRWSRVILWTSVRGWVLSRNIVFRKPWDSVSTYRAPVITHQIRSHAPTSVQAIGVVMLTTTLYQSPLHNAQSTLLPGTRVTVTGWQQTSSGKIWYRIHNLWAEGDGIQFVTPDPGLERSHGLPLWHPVTGKGMWLTLGSITDNAPAAIVEAARRSGISHLFLESAISPLGFHGKDSVGPLLAAAHHNHIAVIAWMYPYLYDVGADVDLTRQVVQYRSASGEAFDGIAADLERNMYVWTIRAYSQLVRAYVGRSYLLVGVTYPPQSGSEYPFAEVAHNYNVIAPMDYWHQTKTSYGLDYGHMAYGYDYAFKYASDSISMIRKVSGHVPIAPIGQTFDNFGRLEMGPHAPSAAEIKGFLQGSKQTGAIGASFFQWMTAAIAEWNTIRAFRF